MSKPGQRQTRWTPKKEAEFLVLLAQGHTVAHAASVIRVGRATAYEHRAMNAAFALAWDEAFDAGTEVLEQEARRRAVQGTERPVFHQGVQVGKVREYSDTLLIFLLKGRKPETYRDNVNINARIAPDLSGLLALARESSDYQLETRPDRVLPGRVGEDPLGASSGDSH